MYPKINITSDLNKIRHKTKYKKIKVLAKIDGQNFYDISMYVKSVKTNNQFEFLDTPNIDTAKIIVSNRKNIWTTTQYNDEFNPEVGKLNGTIEQAFLSKEWEVKISVIVDNNEEITIFTGIKTEITDKHQTAELKINDKSYYTLKKKLNNDILYINKTPDYIIKDLLNRTGYTTADYDIQTFTTPLTFLAKKDSTIWKTLLNLLKGTAGKISTTPDGKIICRSRLEEYTDPEVAAVIKQDTFKKYDLSTENRFNRITVEADGFAIGEEQEVVTATDTGEIKWEGYPLENGEESDGISTFELEYISEYAINVSPNAFLDYSYDSAVTQGNVISQGYNDGIIEVLEYNIYADKVIIKIKNLTVESIVKIDDLKIEGYRVNHKKIEKVIRENTSQELDKELAITSFYPSKAQLSKIADITYDDINKKINFGLSMEGFYPDIYAGNLITFEIPYKGINTGTFIVQKVEHSIEGSLFQSSITILEWKGLSYSVGDKSYESITSTRDNNYDQRISDLEGTVEEVSDTAQEAYDKTQYMDKKAPTIPSNLSLATTINNYGESVIRVSYDSNTEGDLLGYEVAYSLDGSNWRNYTTTETLSEFSVPGNIDIYVKVRALDIEGNKSGWSEAAQIKSEKDKTPPAIPTELTAQGLFQKIKLKWKANTEIDFKEYIIQIATDSNFSQNLVEIKTSSNYLVYSGQTNTTYYFKIKAIDQSGNESEFSTFVNASTVKAYDSDIESQILNNAKDDLDYLNDTKIPELEGSLSEKLDNLPGEITETLISDNSISTAKIKTNAITASKIYAAAVTSDKLAANSVTANAVGANQIITNTANIANSIIQTAHIKDAAIENAKIKDGAITNAKIGNAEIDDAKIANIDAGKITTGYIDSDRIEAGTITSDKLIAKPAFSLPEGAIAYFTDSMIDHVNGITPEGYDEINLSPKITLLPENAPPGSVVASLMVADKIYAEHIASNTIDAEKLNVTELSSITGNVGTLNAGVIKGNDSKTIFDLNNDKIDVSGNVKLGKSVLPDGSDGLYITNGKFAVKNSSGTTTIDGSKNILKIILSGQVSIGAGATKKITFTNLGYKPAFMFFAQGGNNDYDSNTTAQFPLYVYWERSSLSGPDEWGLWCWTYNNYIGFHNFYSSTKTVRYYVFQEVGL
jgi:hypothetical protein